MPYRFTDTDKWADAWFTNLKPIEKLLFIYLYENCDMAGFIELNLKRWCADIGLSIKIIEGALKGLGRGLIISDTMDCIFVRTYLKHQKNLPLNPEKNPAHRGIIKRFELYRYKFKIENINTFIEGACKGLGSPLGNGKGNGNGKKEGYGGKIENKEIVFKSEVFEFSEKYPETMLDKFISYWTELNKSQTKMRYEMQPTFEISKRLATWASRDKEIIKAIIEPENISYKELVERFNKGETAIWEKYEPVTPGDKRTMWKRKSNN